MMNKQYLRLRKIHICNTFSGLHEFQMEGPFDSSSMPIFDADFINDINDRIVQNQRETSSDEGLKNDHPDQDGGTLPSGSKAEQGTKKYHQGKLVFDVTCAPSDIAYPTDVGLLNKA